MPGFRTPGPLGARDEPDPFQPGISIPNCFGSEGAGGWFLGNPASRPGSGSRRPTAAVPTAPVLLRRTSGPACVPLLGLGSTGGDVRKLQALLNLRLSPSPALRVDGSFGPLTAAAVRQLQSGASIHVDGIAGKDTWRVLGTGKVYAGGQTAPPSATASLAAESAQAAAPASMQAMATSRVTPIDDVLGWTAERKFLAVAQRAIDKMPGAARTELLAMISPNAVGVTLALWAASHLVGAGVVIDLALFGAGVFMVGTAVIGVMEELGHCLVQTHNAANQQELDEAAGMLAHVTVVVGVTVLVALLAKIRLKGRGASQTGAAAEAEAAGAARPKRSAPARKPVVDQAAPTPQRTVPVLGRKLDYLLGKATGNAHNIERSTGMLRQLESIGLPDKPATREYLARHLSDVVNDAGNIVRTQTNGRVVRESLLTGPNGILKLESVWEGDKLITGTLLGGR